MSEVPEVFDVFEKKLAQVLSFTLVTHPNSTKKAVEELLTYFSSVVERASKAESRIAELEAAQLWTKGGDGSHWEGCEDVHWIARLYNWKPD